MCHQIIGGIRPRHRACMQVVISMSLRDILAGPASFLFFFFLLLLMWMSVRTSLRVPRLISRVLKLTTI